RILRPESFFQHLQKNHWHDARRMARGVFKSESARRTLIPSKVFLFSTTESKAAITIFALRIIGRRRNNAKNHFRSSYFAGRRGRVRPIASASGSGDDRQSGGESNADRFLLRRRFVVC